MPRLSEDGCGCIAAVNAERLHAALDAALTVTPAVLLEQVEGLHKKLRKAKKKLCQIAELSNRAAQRGAEQRVKLASMHTAEIE
eukprot:3906364-Prymnesium_polylepis.1